MSPSRRTHHLTAFSFFLLLGLQVGVWTVQLAPLADALRLPPGPFGLALTAVAGAGVVTLFAGRRLADRLGRRPVLLLGLGGSAVPYALLALVGSLRSLVAVLILYGLLVSFVDLGANAVGADHERAHRVQAMTGLHAGFSLGAVLGAAGAALALAAGAGFRTVYLALAVLLAGAVGYAAVAPLPPRPAAEPGPSRAGGRAARVWRVPGVAYAIAVATVMFFGDGALQAFLALYLRRALSSGVLLSGAGIGGYHLASLTGRLLATRVLRRWGTKRTITAAGVVGATGLALAVTTSHAGAAVGGLLLVGLAAAPVVPSTLSLAGRATPDRAGQAVAVTTAAGYGAFLVSPVLVGGFAQVAGLRAAMAALVAIPVAIAVLGRRWPDYPLSK